jgi:hypothetical protein
MHGHYMNSGNVINFLSLLHTIYVNSSYISLFHLKSRLVPVSIWLQNELRLTSRRIMDAPSVTNVEWDVFAILHRSYLRANLLKNCLNQCWRCLNLVAKDSVVAFIPQNIYCG